MGFSCQVVVFGFSQFFQTCGIRVQMGLSRRKIAAALSGADEGHEATDK
jgi:hypothetical protein